MRLSHRFQTPEQVEERKDHVWVRDPHGFKCVLCGARTRNLPPPFPTDPNWMPETYEPLTQDERQQCLRRDEVQAGGQRTS